MKKLPDFVHINDPDEIQPFRIRRQGQYIAVIQWDGTGEYRHWALLPIKKLKTIIKKMKKKAA